MDPNSSYFALEDQEIPAEAVEEPAIQSQPRSPRKSHQPKPKAQLQLFNPAHKKELIEIFQGLKLFQLDGDGDEGRSVEEPEADEEAHEIEVESAAKGDDEPNQSQEPSVWSCTTCNCAFGSIREQREHYRLDWHRYNVKRKVHGQAVVTELEFDEIVDGLSSISGSDSSDTEENSTPSATASVISKLMNKIDIEAVSSRSAKAADASNWSGKKGTRKLKGSPKAFLENSGGDIVMIYKTILGPGAYEAASQGGEIDLTSRFLAEPSQAPRWAVIMLSGGHFAATIVEGGQEHRRKTFHSYTVRAKQGGAQGSRDAKAGGGGGPKSAGASLRRYNEAAFAQHIQELLESWKADLDSCEWIFYRALSFNEKILFGNKGSVLSRSDARLKTIPFPTKRPTNSEVKRVIAFLSAVQVYGKEEFLEQFLLPAKKGQEQSPPKSPKKGASANIDRAKSRSPKRREEPERPATTTPEDSDPEDGTFVIEEGEEEVDLEERLAEFGDSLTHEERQRQGSREPRKRRPRRAAPKPQAPQFQPPTGVYGELLKVVTQAQDQSAPEVICEILDKIQRETQENSIIEGINQRVDEAQSTFLHLAAQKGLVDLIWKLLEFGADPASKDKSGKYPYNYADSKDARLVFRRFRAQYPSKYDYQRAQVPEPLTEEQEREKAEKKAALNKLKREKEKQKKAQAYERKAETEEKERFLGLSDREKRALAAERRILGQAKREGEKVPILVRCFDCGVDITGKTPFEYNKNAFCSTKCLATHRKKFPTQLTA